MNLPAAIAAIILAINAVSAENAVTIWAPSMPPGWPVAMAPVIPSSIKIPSSAQFRWEFPDDPSNDKCTIQGKENVSPCIGRVLDHVFSGIGTHQIKLTISDKSMSKPLVVTKQVQIASAESFPQAQRSEIRQLSDDQWSIIVNGFYLLKSLGIYDHLALIHFTSFSVARQSNAGQRSAAHSSASFLTWHRMNNRVVERYLQEATGYSNLGIPYWDWQKGWNGLDKYLGPDGRSGDHAVASGPFCNVNTPGCPQKWPLPSSVEDYKLGIRRQLGVDKGFHFLTQAEYDKLMAIPYYDLPPFSEAPTPNSFRNAIEGWLAQNDSSCGFNHNGVHRWIGGTMGNVVNSFHDPIFLLVHCEVDRLFTIWQQKHKCDDGKGSAECYRPGDTDPAVNASLVGAQMLPGSDGKPRYALKGNMFFDVMYPWATKNRDMLRAQVGYVFLGTNEKPNFGSKSDDKNNSSGTVPVSNLPKVPSGGSGGYAVVPLTALSLSLLVLLFQ